jgi:hypothetical protein
MSEPTTSEPTVAEKRAALKAAGVEVGARGKLSASQEAKFDELRANGQA